MPDIDETAREDAERTRLLEGLNEKTDPWQQDKNVLAILENKLKLEQEDVEGMPPQ
jgi:hypothetical protein